MECLPPWGKPVARTLARGGAVSWTFIWPWSRGLSWKKVVSVTRARSVFGRMCSKAGVLVSVIVTAASSAPAPVPIHKEPATDKADNPHEAAHSQSVIEAIVSQ